jgi:predicted DNA-binding transcriptional regulator YafY
MRRLARRRAILDALRAEPHGATAEHVAQTLGVSARTVYRDLEKLRAEGEPVEAGRGPGGGYRWSEQDAHATIKLSANDARWLLAVLDAVLDAHWLPFRETTQRLRDEARTALAAAAQHETHAPAIRTKSVVAQTYETFEPILERALLAGERVRTRIRKGRTIVEQLLTPIAAIAGEAEKLRARDENGVESDLDLERLIAVEPADEGDDEDDGEENARA